MTKVIQEQMEAGNKDLKVSIYIPSIDGLSNEAQGAFATSTVHPPVVKDTYTKYQNLHFGIKQNKISGKNTSQIAKSSVDLVLSVYQVAKKKVSIFGIGTSAFDLYKAFAGVTTIQGKEGDELYFDLVYDRLHKLSYCSTDGGNTWIYSLSTLKYWLNTFYLWQYYQMVGKYYYKTEFVNKVIYSEHYNSSVKTAIEKIGSGYCDPQYGFKLFNYYLIC